MATLAERFNGEAYQGSACTYHGLVIEQDLEETPLLIEDLDAISYSIRNVDTGAFVVQDQALTVADVLSDTITTVAGKRYNFTVQFPHTSFPECGLYEVVFKFVSSDAANTVTYGKIEISVEGVQFTDA
jgi:hypothetical protein